jgi:penicillin-binding protein 1A
MRFFVRFLGFLFTAGAILFVVGAVGATWAVWHFSKDLPDYSALQNYEPPVMTRVHASDGSLVAEYAKERRLYLPVQAIPKRVFDAFTAAEDKNFWSHGGIDLFGIARAVVNNLEQLGTGRRPQGASTITQQVAKNFLVGNETSINRKIKEALLALRIERAYSKEKILELYLNEIYLGPALTASPRRPCSTSTSRCISFRSRRLLILRRSRKRRTIIIRSASATQRSSAVTG